MASARRALGALRDEQDGGRGARPIATGRTRRHWSRCRYCLFRVHRHQTCARRKRQARDLRSPQVGPEDHDERRAGRPSWNRDRLPRGRARHPGRGSEVDAPHAPAARADPALRRPHGQGPQRPIRNQCSREHQARLTGPYEKVSRPRPSRRQTAQIESHSGHAECIGERTAALLRDARYRPTTRAACLVCSRRVLLPGDHRTMTRGRTTA